MWTADVIVKKRCFTTNELDKRGNPRKVFYRAFSVVVTNGIDQLLFSVGRNGWLGDSRGETTGLAGVTGPWNTGKQLAKAGVRKSIHPNEWIKDMSRLIGYDRAVEVIEQIRFAKGVII